MKYIIETLIRWRTWIVNTFFAILVILPDLINALLGFNWGDIVPAKYLPLVTLFILIVNVIMRPRPAVLASDPEVKFQKLVSEMEEADYENGEHR